MYNTKASIFNGNTEQNIYGRLRLTSEFFLTAKNIKEHELIKKYINYIWKFQYLEVYSTIDIINFFKLYIFIITYKIIPQIIPVFDCVIIFLKKTFEFDKKFILETLTEVKNIKINGCNKLNRQIEFIEVLNDAQKLNKLLDYSIIDKNEIVDDLNNFNMFCDIVYDKLLIFLLIDDGDTDENILNKLKNLSICSSDEYNNKIKFSLSSPHSFLITIDNNNILNYSRTPDTLNYDKSLMFGIL
jgi:hypothetical protein